MKQLLQVTLNIMKINTYISDSMPPLKQLPPIAMAKVAYA